MLDRKEIIAIVYGQGQPTRPKPTITLEEAKGGLRGWLASWVAYEASLNKEKIGADGKPKHSPTAWKERKGCPNCPRCNSEDTFSKLPTDTSLLQHHLTDPNFMPNWDKASPEQEAEIQLLYQLSKIKSCPLYMYDNILQWAKEYVDLDVSTGGSQNQILSKMDSRETALKKWETLIMFFGY